MFGSTNAQPPKVFVSSAASTDTPDVFVSPSAHAGIELESASQFNAPKASANNKESKSADKQGEIIISLSEGERNDLTARVDNGIRALETKLAAFVRLSTNDKFRALEKERVILQFEKHLLEKKQDYIKKFVLVASDEVNERFYREHFAKYRANLTPEVKPFIDEQTTIIKANLTTLEGTDKQLLQKKQDELLAWLPIIINGLVIQFGSFEIKDGFDDVSAVQNLKKAKAENTKKFDGVFKQLEDLKDKMSDLQDAIRLFSLLKQRIQKGHLVPADINSPGGVQLNYIGFHQYLVDQIKIHKRNPNEVIGKHTALQFAFIFGDLELAKELIVLGANPCVNPENLLMHLVIQRNYPNCVEFLKLIKIDLLHKKSAYSFTNKFKQTPFELAAFVGNYEAATWLMGELLTTKFKKIDVHEVDDICKKPLHNAITQGHVKIVAYILKYLIAAHRYQESLSVDKKSPVFNAVLSGHVDVCQLFKDSGIIPNKAELDSLEALIKNHPNKNAMIRCLRDVFKHDCSKLETTPAPIRNDEAEIPAKFRSVRAHEAFKGAASASPFGVFSPDNPLQIQHAHDTSIQQGNIKKSGKWF